ncbi:MAG TPA: hypothetical protein VMW56_00250 [Candidatus Margulisiibacteriota bacterium]|nr:hypothetical protein [Candidatus Margulisiibacteriota bacterium]
METKKAGMSPGNRLETGTVVLAAAQVVDVELVKPRLTAFASAQQSYAEAQRNVETAEAQLVKGQARLSRCDAVQDDAVEALARALLADGQPRRNPFAAFGGAPPWAIKKLKAAPEAKAVHQLTGAVQRSNMVSKAVLEAAQAADAAARTVEAALLPIEKLQLALRDARHTRDAIGQTWNTALAALKRGARAAADDGAPGLYTALFGRLTRPNTRKNAKTPPAPPAPPAPATNAA